MSLLGGRRALITGGLGFLGGALAHALVAADADVLIVDALVPGSGGTYRNIAGIENAVRVVEADLRDGELLPALLDDRDLVFNLAGLRSHIDSLTHPHADLEMNCSAQLTLLEACRRLTPAPTVVYAGTRQIYGRPQYLPVDEAHPIEPLDVNGIHKSAAEQYHFLYSRLYGIPVSVLRLTNTYGPGMRVRDARQTFLGAWLQALVRGDEFEIWGDGNQVRDFTYVDDAVAAFLLVAGDERAHGRAFNLGDDRGVSLRQLADLLVAENGGGTYRVVPFPADRTPIDIGDYVGDYRAIRELLGWRPGVSLEEGLARTLAYYREHGSDYWDDPGDRSVP
jgi:UDP-glucose 4-epimerase